MKPPLTRPFGAAVHGAVSFNRGGGGGGKRGRNGCVGLRYSGYLSGS